jgi:hypothetical protein
MVLGVILEQGFLRVSVCACLYVFILIDIAKENTENKVYQASVFSQEFVMTKEPSALIFFHSFILF